MSEIIPFTVTPQYHDEQFLRQKYLVERLSTRQISAQICSARSTVTRYLKKYGIEIRHDDHARRLNKGQVGYGEKRVRGVISPNGSELEKIDRLFELREQGMSYWKIAAFLNTMAVPTKNRNSRWHPTTVMKILRAAEQREAGGVGVGPDGVG